MSDQLKPGTVAPGIEHNIIFHPSLGITLVAQSIQQSLTCGQHIPGQQRLSFAQRQFRPIDSYTVRGLDLPASQGEAGTQFNTVVPRALGAYACVVIPFGAQQLFDNGGLGADVPPVGDTVAVTVSGGVGLETPPDFIRQGRVRRRQRNAGTIGSTDERQRLYRGQQHRRTDNKAT